MLAEVGTFLVGLALAVALYTAFAAFWAIRRADSRWAEGRAVGYGSDEEEFAKMVDSMREELGE